MSRHEDESRGYSSDEESDSSWDSLSSDDDEEETQASKRRALMVGGVVSTLLSSNRKKEGRKTIYRDRLTRTAAYYISLGEQDGHFLRFYGMDVPAFKKLSSYLLDSLSPKPRAGKRSIDAETKVMISLRFFRGGTYPDICREFGIGTSTVFAIADQVSDAINACPHFGIPKWPENKEECDVYANEWARLSGPPEGKGLFTTAVGMVDGILVRIQSPSKKDDARAEDYRSGHKKAIGLNVQAMCDAKLRFLFISSLTPGKTNDLKAYTMSELSRKIEALPEGYWCGGDNAYTNSEHLLVPFPGRDKPQRQDAFNFYFSQLRVRIENAFALWVNRWGILWTPLQGTLEQHGKRILTIAKLHNFAIDEKIPLPHNDDPRWHEFGQDFRLRRESEYGTEVMHNREVMLTRYHHASGVQGTILRDSLADDVQFFGYSRPRANLERNGVRS